MIDHPDWSRGESRILAQRCPEGHVWYLPRTRCPRCSSADVESFEPGGRGTVFALTSLHRRSDGASEVVRIALVDLDDGIRLMTRASPAARIGSRVVVTAEAIGPDHRMLPTSEVLPE